MALKILSFGFDAYWREGQNLIPSLTPYLAIIFCVMCLYCSLGLQSFGGLVYANNPKLEGASLKNDDYVLFNFNDYPSGISKSIKLSSHAAVAAHDKDINSVAVFVEIVDNQVQ